nr:AlNc14C11G1311 [Albugo laibachii Nc14]|eukprot:CCA15364.1 AlNc14C11G1311 [Albugo laibachii Nc14]
MTEAIVYSYRWAECLSPIRQKSRRVPLSRQVTTFSLRYSATTHKLSQNRSDQTLLSSTKLHDHRTVIRKCISYSITEFFPYKQGVVITI